MALARWLRADVRQGAVRRFDWERQNRKDFRPSSTAVDGMAAGDTSASGAETRGFAALRHRDFAIYVISKLLTYSSHQALMIAIGYQIYDLTGDAIVPQPEVWRTRHTAIDALRW